MSASPDLQRLHGQALAALKYQQFDEAADLLVQFLKSKPRDFDAELELAIARSGQGKNAAALVILDRLVERDRQSIPAAFRRAVVLEKLGRKAEAAQAYQLVLRSDPNHSEEFSKLKGLSRSLSEAKTLARNSEEAEEVQVVETETQRRPKRINRPKESIPLITPWRISSLFIGMVTLAGIAGRHFGAYAAGFVFGKLFLAASILILGFWLAHRFRTSQGNLGKGIGYALAIIGGCGFIAVPIFYILVPYVSNPGGGKELRIAENSSQAANSQQERIAAESRRLDKAIADLRSGETFRIIRGTGAVISTNPNSERRFEIIGLLENLLNTSDWSVRHSVIDALGWLGTVQSISKLEPFLMSRDVAVKMAANSSIDKIRRRESPETFEALEVDKIIADLRSNDTNRIRSGAAKALTSRHLAGKQVEVVQLLEGHLSSPNQMIRTFVIKSLGEWGTTQTIVKLEPFLNDTQAGIRQDAKLAIDQIRRREKKGS